MLSIKFLVLNASFDIGNNILVSNYYSNEKYSEVNMENGYFGLLLSGTYLYWYVYDKNGHKIVDKEISTNFGGRLLNTIQINEKLFNVIYTNKNGLNYITFDLDGNIITNEKITLISKDQYWKYDYDNMKWTFKSNTKVNNNLIHMISIYSTVVTDSYQRSFGITFKSNGEVYGANEIDNYHIYWDFPQRENKQVITSLSSNGFITSFYYKSQTYKDNIITNVYDNNFQLIETITDDGCILYPQLTTSINNFFILFRVCKESGQWDNNEFYHQISFYDNNGNLIDSYQTDFYSVGIHKNGNFRSYNIKNIINYENENKFVIPFDGETDKTFSITFPKSQNTGIDKNEYQFLFINNVYYNEFYRIKDKKYFDSWYDYNNRKNYLSRYDVSSTNSAIKMITPEPNTNADYSLISTKSPTITPTKKPTTTPTKIPTINLSIIETSFPTGKPTDYKNEIPKKDNILDDDLNQEKSDDNNDESDDSGKESDDSNKESDNSKEDSTLKMITIVLSILFAISLIALYCTNKNAKLTIERTIFKYTKVGWSKNENENAYSTISKDSTTPSLSKI